MSSDKQTLGRWGEQYAADYLQAKGFEIVERNARTEYGEIDLVTRLNQELIFVEVKTRSSDAFGYPEEAITEVKQQHMIESAQTYLQTHNEESSPWRIDVIAIQQNSKEHEPEILHIENALG